VNFEGIYSVALKSYGGLWLDSEMWIEKIFLH